MKRGMKRAMKRAKFSGDEDRGRPLKVKPEVDWQMFKIYSG